MKPADSIDSTNSANSANTAVGEDELMSEPGSPSAASSRWLQALLCLAVIFASFAAGNLWGTRSAEPPSGPVDVGFLNDMSLHHDQAVEMSNLALVHAEDPGVRGFARDILIFQRYELGAMNAMLAERSLRRAGSDQPVMGWMGMSMSAQEMPGLASEAEMKELGELRGREFDLQFLKLMIEHHRGGVHMAEYAAAKAEDPRVVDLASLVVRDQNAEIAEFNAYIAKLEKG